MMLWPQALGMHRAPLLAVWLLIMQRQPDGKRLCPCSRSLPAQYLQWSAGRREILCPLFSVSTRDPLN
ncbi:hypothetical protein WJX84_009574 [Apatococcus fuscideae]|uniref:Secreted protein n=1 Tax=Apatococcus fuscideae TaxID=2026836 RepID=A0AAW1TFM2_9CHLO